MFTSYIFKSRAPEGSKGYFKISIQQFFPWTLKIQTWERVDILVWFLSMLYCNEDNRDLIIA